MEVKENQVYKLLKIFSIILILIMTIFTLLVSYTIFKRNNEKAEQSLFFISEKMLTLTQENFEYTKDKSTALTEKAEKIERMNDYFEMSYSNYLEQSLNLATSADEFHYFPNEVNRLYTETRGLNSINIALENFEEVYTSSTENKFGKKANQIPPSKGIRFSANLKFPYTGQGFGTIHMDFDRRYYDEVLQSVNYQVPLEIFLLSDTNQLLYYENTNKSGISIKKNILEQINTKSDVNIDSFKQEYLFRESIIENGYRLLVFIPRQTILLNSLDQSSGLIIFSLFVDVLLLVVLFVLFRKYVNQVEDILNTSMAVSQGDSQSRISLDNKNGEMKQIAQSINKMLDSMQNYLKDIYDLEIKQRDAQMGALQAQINPHFLYNTLEYIRMSAVSEGADELGEVVYSFGALLRNNISQEKMVSLESELEFCEKYVYLYQMRYPNQIAYNFRITDEVKQFKIPKFTIQPLIENYFAHGIDFTKIENAISIKAYKKEHTLVIKIIDNGVGMSLERLRKLNQDIVNNVEPSKTAVGVLNVNQRLNLTFGEQAKVRFEQSSTTGVTVTIKIDQEGDRNV